MLEFLGAILVFGSVNFFIYAQNQERGIKENIGSPSPTGYRKNAGVHRIPVTAPVTILYKPRAPYSDGSVCVQGTVTLMVTFQADGKVGDIEVISGLPYGFNDSAIDAARKIRFVPAKQNGVPVTKKKAIQYSFSIY